MKPVFRGLACFAFCFAIARAEGASIDFSYSDTSGDAAIGAISGSSSGFSDGSLWITGGTIDVTSYAFADGVTGVFYIPPATANIGPNPGFYANSANVDNLWYPADNAASGDNSANLAGNPSYIDNFGLYAVGSGPTAGYAVNIFGNGNGDYAIVETAQPSGAYDGSNPFVGGTVVLIPEPSGAIAMLGVGLAALLFVPRRRRSAEL